MDGWKEFLPILQDFVPHQGRWLEIKDEQLNMKRAAGRAPKPAGGGLRARWEAPGGMEEREKKIMECSWYVMVP